MSPRRATCTPREPERDYSHRSLLDKLGVKPEHRIAVLRVEDEAFSKELVARAQDVSRNRPKSDSDLLFFAAESRKDLDRLKSLTPFLKKTGAIWVVYPKGQTHIREIDVISAGKASGLVDNKVVRFSETHTALRLVIPVAQR
jgi:hypothetical protein